MDLKRIVNIFSFYWQSGIPEPVLFTVISVSILAVFIMFYYRHYLPYKRLYFSPLLIGYAILVCCSTVIYRPDYGVHDYSFDVFWSYSEIIEGNDDLIAEIGLNVILFIPFGFLAGILLNVNRWRFVIMLGFCFSSSIELMQFVFRRGLCEIDDIIHNTLGCVIGYLIFIGFVTIYKMIKK